MNHPHMKKIIASFMVLFWSALIGNNQPEEIITFNTLFPDNWYTKTLQNCMYVWSDLDAIITNKSIDLYTASYMIDAAIGRIVFCLSCLKKMGQEQAVAIVEDDLLYLGRITVSLNNRCEKLVNDPGYKEHAELLKNMLVKFRTSLTRALGR